jgi:ribonuclease P protein component
LGSYSFPKTERLLKRACFTRLSSFGKKVQTRYFIALISPGITDKNRIGLTVSKRVGKAVERNRIKRVIREFYRSRRSTLAGPRDINIIARKQVSDLANGRIFVELDNLFKKIANHNG